MIPVTFPDIVITLADYLASALAARGVTDPVVAEVPDPRPDRFVRVVRIGGPRTNLITDTPRIVAECWDTSGAGAAELASVTRALIVAAAPGYLGSAWVGKAIDRGVSYSPDPDTGTPRYLITAELVMNGAPLS
ncbi:hypothetical protein [Nocardia abscessus]|uniref:hypothetical protein n=1 Tax=Nocardia abscessus TaxID=120957 RepID=UPI0002FF516C|nr:hypothetical protein [Nocardia abscessus]MCC3333591.1 hypothetical protein [Nocardia abscessus]